MRSFLLSILLLLAIGARAQFVNIPDTDFVNYLTANYPGCMSGSMLDTTCPAVVNETYLHFGTNPTFLALNGIEYFDNLDTLILTVSPLMDIPRLPASLTYIDLYNNWNLVTLPALPPNLEYLNCALCDLSTLPALPSTLRYLNFQSNNISSLPAVLPPVLEDLNCSSNQIGSLPVLPSTLINLSCAGSSLTALPSLPAGLQTLNCRSNSLQQLPTLPSSLTSILAWWNQLDSLPVLPSALTHLEVSQNQLQYLPPLPPGLLHLDLKSNQLLTLPSLPASLEFLDCSSNQISVLPPLPSNLHTLTANYLSNLHCLPVLPSSLIVLYLNGTPVTCLPNLPHSNFQATPHIPDICTTSNSNCAYPSITGKIYLDINANGTQDAGEPVLPNKIVQAQPGGYYASSRVTGYYQISADTGTYTVSMAPGSYYLADTAYSITITNPNQTDSLNDFGLLLPAVPVNDLKINYYFTTNIRPGFPSTQVVTYTNHGTDTVASGYVQLVHDTALVYQSSTPAASSVSSDTLTWSFSSLVPGASSTIYVSYTLPATVPIGTPIVQYLSVRPVVGDTTPADNDLVLEDIVTGAVDPNNKEVAPAGDITPSQVSSGDRLFYVINFQNTGTDTAFTVVLEDTLSSNLFIPSFELVGSSHPCTWEISGQGMLKFTFNNILLPDSFVNEPASHGSVAYTIRPKTSLSIGDSIANTAYIYFDFNTAIVTNTVVTRVDLATGIATGGYDEDGLLIYPNPAESTVNISLKHKGACRYTISMIDMTGRTVYSSSIPAAGELKQEIRLHDLAKGMYCVRVEGCDKVMTGRVIKK